MVAPLMPPNGLATFVPLQNRWPLIHQANRNAVCNRAPERAYCIRREIQFYSDSSIVEWLSQPDALPERLGPPAEDFTGESQNRLHCIALVSNQSGQGLLLNRWGSAWQCACLPLITSQLLAQEAACARQLRRWAQEETVAAVRRTIWLPEGQWTAAQVLEWLADELE